MIWRLVGWKSLQENIIQWKCRMKLFVPTTAALSLSKIIFFHNDIKAGGIVVLDLQVVHGAEDLVA